MTIAAGSPIEATHQVALKIRAFEDRVTLHANFKQM